MRTLAIVALTIVMLVLSAGAYAEPGAADIISVYNGKDAQARDKIALYVSGMAHGFGWINGEAKQNGQSPTFCQPGKLGLSSDIVIQLMSDYLKTHPQLKDQPFGLVAVLTLVDAFPCK